MKILLPRPKQLQNVVGDMPLNAKNRQLYPDAPVKLACPCCNESFANRITLKDHVVLVEHYDSVNILAPIDANPSSSIVTGLPSANWMIGDTNVSECFRQFRAYCLENSSNLLDIDQHGQARFCKDIIFCSIIHVTYFVFFLGLCLQFLLSRSDTITKACLANFFPLL